jgi:hypothetical protein
VEKVSAARSGFVVYFVQRHFWYDLSSGCSMQQEEMRKIMLDCKRIHVPQDIFRTSGRCPAAFSVGFRHGEERMQIRLRGARGTMESGKDK